MVYSLLCRVLMVNLTVTAICVVRVYVCVYEYVRVCIFE